MRRGEALGVALALAAAVPAAAAEQIGPPPHERGPRVFLDYDQAELDAAYDQSAYQPNIEHMSRRFAAASEALRGRLGAPRRFAYGPTAVEGLDVYAAPRRSAPIALFVHGGAWRGGTAKDYAFPAETFVRAGVHFVPLDFAPVTALGGDLGAMADQVRRAIAWTYNNASAFGGDARRLYVIGHSSGAHLAGVALTTDWSSYGIPADAIRGGVLMSGMYDLHPVRLSKRSSYLRLTDAAVAALSSQRHLDRLRAPVVIAYGTEETPEFQRQNREFAAAVRAAGKPAELVVGEFYRHMDVCEALANPYGFTGRAALRLMGIAAA